MDWLIYIGTLFAVIGLAGVVLSGLRVLRARKAGLEDDALKTAVQKAMVLNMGAFAISGFGLMLVVVGVILA